MKWDHVSCLLHLSCSPISEEHGAQVLSEAEFVTKPFADSFPPLKLSHSPPDFQSAEPCLYPLNIPQMGQGVWWWSCLVFLEGVMWNWPCDCRAVMAFFLLLHHFCFKGICAPHQSPFCKASSIKAFAAVCLGECFPLIFVTFLFLQTPRRFPIRQTAVWHFVSMGSAAGSRPHRDPHRWFGESLLKLAKLSMK